MVNVNDIAITSLETITAFDVLTGDLMFVLDELQNANIANTEEKVDITGKSGRKLNSLKRNKAVTITGTNGLVSGGLMEAQTGGSFENKKTTVLWTDYLTVAENKAITSFKAVGTTGNEIENIVVKKDGVATSIAMTQADATAAGKFTYTPSTKTIEFNAGELEDGTELVVYYTRQINASVLENISDKYSKKAVLYVDAFGEDVCSNLYRVQFFIPKADFSGEFSLDMGGDQTVHGFTAESLAGACGANGSLWTYIVFAENTEDVA